MSNIELYIGADLVDFNEPINVVMSVGDIRDISLGNLNKSYTLNVPLTKPNKRIIKHSNLPGSTDEITAIGRLYVNGIQVIYGKIKVLSFGETSFKMIITADDWMEDILAGDLRDIDFTAEDHLYNKTNVIASWTAANAFYRYPMINFGQLVTPATGAQPHDFAVNDFIPMFRLIDIMTYIFSPWTIVSDWFATTYAKTLYILGSETKAVSDFIQNKGLEVKVNGGADNIATIALAAYDTQFLTLDKTKVVLTNEITDEGAYFSTILYQYAVPVTGTYRFQASVGIVNDAEANANIDVLSTTYTVAINKGAVAIASETGSGLINGKTVTLDSKHVHLTAGDYITLKFYARTQLENLSAITQNPTLWLTTDTKLTNTMDEWCRYSGYGKTITAVDYLPDVQVVDLVKAIKHLANLRFFADRAGQNLYIEPAQTFYGTGTEVDLTSFQDYSIEPVLEPISPNYKTKITLGFIEDVSDKAYIEYKNWFGIPDRKEITLTSVYAIPGEQPMLSDLFAHSVRGRFKEILEYDESIVKIFGDQENISTAKPYPAYRTVGFKPRILEWKGLTAGVSFDIDGTNYNTYPKVLPVSFTDLYTNYWITSIHQIDKNVIVTLNIRLPQTTINQLMNVLSVSANEGHRTRYKLLVFGQYVYGYLNSVTTDGEISQCEFIIKN